MATAFATLAMRETEQQCLRGRRLLSRATSSSDENVPNWLRPDCCLSI